MHPCNVGKDMVVSGVGYRKAHIVNVKTKDAARRASGR
jgi:hypothetical protein